jgi:hypothetical protein
MISSTNITSTIGVTLMFELTFAPSFLLACGIVDSSNADGVHIINA